MPDLVPSSDSPVSASSVQQATQPTQTSTPPESQGDAQPKTSIQQPQGYASIGRRAHKKSRTGCSTCKSRKIKCDERHPACLNCISHGVECPFLKPGAGNNASARAPKPKPDSPASSSSTSTSRPNPIMALPEGGELPLLELELLHNFTTKTYTTLTADASVWEFWRDDVVQLGLTCDYIMRAVLAVSALHLAYHRPDRRDFYVEAGILLHQKAARSAMRVMAVGDKIDKDHAANLFLFSMLTMFFALASPRRSNPDGTFFIGESGFPDWAFLLSGGKSIMDVLGEAGLETVASPFLVYGRRRWHAQRALLEATTAAATAATTKDPHQQQQQQHSPAASSPPEPRGPILAPLRARIQTTVSDPALLKTYAHALDELELALVVRQDPAAPRDVLDAMVWLWVMSDEFVPLLRLPTQEAVAIFAHFCVLLKHHESHWWLQGWGDHIMMRAREILDEEHRGWIDWPMREMGWMEGVEE
ncbi:uncharacterized protein B0H64DRAFT_446710 [Chaetomium fimeti]|uniref:Zn(2)-C6 fungal-type domain-containing protein n=1 Tax=Chaetomium fimeti TaxID=1854472 RepID=A0AAE0H6K4_9PEZI|nr:hypothetical protein B0H64DRAFT_446710 [Chaetomium fimeti]